LDGQRSRQVPDSQSVARQTPGSKKRKEEKELMGLFTRDKGSANQETSLTTINNQTKEVAATVDREVLLKYMKAQGLTTSLTPEEAEMYIDTAVLYQLNPFKREIHCTPYGKPGTEWRQVAIVVGYETYIQKAEESGLLEYWDIIECDPGTPLEKYWCQLIVKRRDRKTEQKWTVYYVETVQTKKDGTPNSFWRKQPRFMTKKVCMGQGFRLFFEDVTHGMPYIKEEMPDYSETVLPDDPKPLRRAAPSFDVVDEDETIQAVEEVFTEPVQQESTFSQIMTLINGGSIPNAAKPAIMGDARKNKDNEAELQSILKIMKEEHSL